MPPSSLPGSKPKVIKAPGSNTIRVSVACDRCRKKKIKCFYDEGDEIDPNGRAQCANCKGVGLECIFTDKLARKAFPRGYTESLEERVRELEFENRKLQKLLNLKADTSELSDGPVDDQKPPSLLNDENLSLLNNQKEFKSMEEHLHDETCNCGNFPHAVHNRPVSIAGSVDIDKGDLSDDDISLYSASMGSNYHFTQNADDLRNRYGYNSFEQVNAPGAAAAVSLQNKLRTKHFMSLANLIATAIPRSTEETLFIPSLLAKVVSVHGFNSKAPYLTSKSIALLKEAYNEDSRYSQFPISFENTKFNELSADESKAFFQTLSLPNHVNLDLCISLFFDTWNQVTPVLNKEIFMANYLKFNKSRETNFEDGAMYGMEKFGEMLIIITTLVMLAQERNNLYAHNKEKSASHGELLQFYDHLIKQFIGSSMNSICSITSLQLTTLELLYCLTTADLNTSYELRGKLITMTQQLRLHRCPAAVLGQNGSKVSKLQQGERRILFWCIYTLDTFSALILGVPRLLKDYEVECALPSSSSSDGTDINLITFNNTQLSLVGKVSDQALSVMRFAKVLGTCVDAIFKRSNNEIKKTNIDESSTLMLEHLLESWRKDLPSSLRFDSDIGAAEMEKLTEAQITLLFLYHQAKALIYMPLMATETTNSKNSASYIAIQQSSTAILAISKLLNTAKFHFYHLPLPINTSRQKARFALLAAKGALEYTRGGALFQDSKSLLSSVIGDLKLETDISFLGCLSKSCVEHLEIAIDTILTAPKVNSPPSQQSAETPKKDKKKSSTLRTMLSTPVKVEEEEPAINDIFSSQSPPQIVRPSSFQYQTLQDQMRHPSPLPPQFTTPPEQQQQQQQPYQQYPMMNMQPQPQVQQSIRPAYPQPEQRSYTDLMMLNDFGVDASLGLSLLDFEFDENWQKKQRRDSSATTSNVQDFSSAEEDLWK
ncbi:hypothetical protein OGAPHI_005675 [Ogataea philodendri]|uniref:Zn(2)-C6 fungal-type domain-containing protein n=1 Tax=Ogataea philodendri TaxID=1378263 RepID=A0A9P8NY79_9ASCO|nr:uncharacterized protein OGAPHI_005675 [Ogataea philodendri]KAH3662423.1 hypothetical protein OGAPHI_005675 [Ogataea philodendri]